MDSENYERETAVKTEQKHILHTVMANDCQKIHISAEYDEQCIHIFCCYYYLLYAQFFFVVLYFVEYMCVWLCDNVMQRHVSTPYKIREAKWAHPFVWQLKKKNPFTLKAATTTCIQENVPTLPHKMNEHTKHE